MERTEIPFNWGSLFSFLGRFLLQEEREGRAAARRDARPIEGKKRERERDGIRAWAGMYVVVKKLSPHWSVVWILDNPLICVLQMNLC